jgi:predicted nuclease of predicted toxin-antitoxin system
VKLLLDENLSQRLARPLAEAYPGSAHAADLGLAGAPDRALWARAAADGYVLVTKDEDFHRLSVLLGPPPKVVWLRLGNCATADVARLLLARREQVERFVAHEEAARLSGPHVALANGASKLPSNRAPTLLCRARLMHAPPHACMALAA